MVIIGKIFQANIEEYEPRPDKVLELSVPPREHADARDYFSPIK